MWNKPPSLWNWLPLGLVSFVIFGASQSFNSRFGMGIGILLGFGALVEFLHQIVWIIVDMVKEGRPDTYKLSLNYQAELIKSMNAEQLKAWRRVGAARVSVLTDGTKGSLPVYMVHGTDVSLDFLNHFLNLSTETRVCPVSNFMAGTHHWDWSKDNIIDDYRQAQDCRNYIVRMGWAEWNGNGTAPTWSMAPDGSRWKAEDVKYIHGLDEVEGETA